MTPGPLYESTRETSSYEPGPIGESVKGIKNEPNSGIGHTGAFGKASNFFGWPSSNPSADSTNFTSGSRDDPMILDEKDPIKAPLVLENTPSSNESSAPSSISAATMSREVVEDLQIADQPRIRHKKILLKGGNKFNEIYVSQVSNKWWSRGMGHGKSEHTVLAGYRSY